MIIQVPEVEGDRETVNGEEHLSDWVPNNIADFGCAQFMQKKANLVIH